MTIFDPSLYERWGAYIKEWRMGKVMIGKRQIFSQIKKFVKWVKIPFDVG